MARADVKVSILDTPTFRAVIERLGEIAAHDPPTSAAFAIGFGAAWIGAGFGALIGMSDRG